MKKRKCIMKNMETGAEDKNQQTAIYVMTHKAFTPPPDPLYIPLHVGRAAASSYSRDEKSSPLSFCVGDNTGDHISEKNCYYRTDGNVLGMEKLPCKGSWYLPLPPVSFK